MSDDDGNQEAEPLLNGHRRARTFLGPLDWGLAFAWAFKWPILLLCLVPLIAELVASYWLFYDRLMRKHLLLIFIGTAATNVWFISTVLLLAVRVAAERTYSVKQLALQAVKQLPKPFLSYFATVAIVLAGATALIFPGLVFLGFLLWAPAFCAGEIAVEQPPRPQGRPVDEERERGFFQNRSILDLGLVRSVRLAGKNYPYSVQLALLMICAALAPGVLIEVLVPDNLVFCVQVLKSTLSSLVTALVVGAWAGTFVMLLPAAAKREVGIQSYPDPRDFYPGKVLPRYEGRVVLQGVIVVVGMFASWIFMQSMLTRVEMPESVWVQLASVKQRDGEIVVDLTMNDSEHNFRWFSPDMFKATVPVPPAAADAPQESNPAWYESVFSDGSTDGQELRELELARYDMIAESGEKLTDEAISPLYEPLRVVLAYKLPPGEVKGPLVVRYGKKRFPVYDSDIPPPEKVAGEVSGAKP